jgi:hypothetical protein
MTFQPPLRTTQLRAVDLTSAGTPYLVKGLDDDDSAWNLVEARPICRLVPPLPQEVTVIFTDGAVRVFEPQDQVLVGPVTNRVGGDRQEIREVADGHGWDRPPNDTKDLFTRGMFQVEVFYVGDAADTARHIRGGQQLPYTATGRGAKTTAISWLTSNRPDQV